MNLQTTYTTRPEAIVTEYLAELDRHIEDLKAGRVDRTFEVRDFADLLHIHPRHLSNTLTQVLKRSPCDLYESRLLAAAQELLISSNEPIAEIARRLTYDPSNFTRFFKRFTGITPGQYRTRYQILN